MSKKRKKRTRKLKIDIKNLHDYEAEIIQMLRKEAWEVKHCFTQYSFQVIAFSVAAMGLILEFQEGKPYLGFVSMLVVVLILAVARMGAFKYATASRNLGYELHLQRTARLIPEENGIGWQHHMREIGWEEAMRAWRNVQATIFAHLHIVSQDCPNDLKKPYALPEKERTSSSEKDVYRWYLPRELALKGYSDAEYFPGAYLKVMMNVFKYLMMFSLISLYIVPIQYLYKLHLLLAEAQPSKILILIYCAFFIFGVFLAIAFTRFTYNQFQIIQSRRKSIESGFLSIHSCAIVWQVVVFAHYLALRELGSVKGKVKEYNNYTEYLSRQVKNVLPYLEEEQVIGDWLAERPLRNIN